ncbi:MAG: cell division protein ZapE [Trueperaceae bacterium]|nr:cell division protein ZapE [Trueperaceae bacterium]
MPRRLAELPSPATLDLDSLVPPPRFGRVDFDSFVAHDPSQAAARLRVEAAALATRAPQGRRFGRWRRRPAAPLGLYLDGGFGVGKTHLLAAAFHAAPVASKRYLSFQELVYLIGVMGMRVARERLGDARLYCLDEFELDDPGNTLIVKTFLAHVFESGALVITTSNTPPEAQGAGRFNAEDFVREIQSIAERFTVVPIEGPDARRGLVGGRLLGAEDLPTPPTEVVRATWREFLDHLASHHPSRYRAHLEAAGGIVVEGVEPIGGQNDALRFVHFVDKAYDLRIPLWLSGDRSVGDVAIDDLFDPSYAGGAYAKKYHRASSRLAEILREARALTARRASVEG